MATLVETPLPPILVDVTTCHAGVLGEAHGKEIRLRFSDDWNLALFLKKGATSQEIRRELRMIEQEIVKRYGLRDLK